jgi:hypothetical protein
MIERLLAAYLVDTDHQALLGLATPAKRRAALLAPKAEGAIEKFVQHLATDSQLWSGQGSELPKTAYNLVLSQLLRPGPLLFQRSLQLQRQAAHLLRTHGLMVPEVQLATVADIVLTGPAIVTVRRSLLGGARVFSSGSVQDFSWQGAVRKIFSL